MSNTSGRDKDEILEFPKFESIDSTNCRNFENSKNKLYGVDKKHFYIYLISFIVSIGLIIPYLFVPENHICAMFMSIGASGVGAAFLGYFIEMSTQKIERERAVREYNNSVIAIYYDLWLVFANKSYDFMKNINSYDIQSSLSKQSADKFIIQIHIVMPKVDSFIIKYCDIYDEDTNNFFHTLKTQLVQFEASLHNASDTKHLIALLEGIRTWLREYCELDKVIKLLVK